MGRLARMNAQRRGLAKVEAFDGFAPLRNGLRRIAGQRGDWAGIPMPIEGNPLVIEPKFPNAAGLSEIGRDPEEQRLELEAEKELRNTWWSKRLRRRVYIWNEDGKIAWTLGNKSRLPMEIMTLGASTAWGIEQEHKALNMLATELRHANFKQYLLTGMFLETSHRSGVKYLFRKLKPTVALRMDEDGTTRILCTLCLHPIAYYEGSWAGAMTPTDDVLAHLLLMRGDEAMFWRRANQHAPDQPQSGL